MSLVSLLVATIIMQCVFTRGSSIYIMLLHTAKAPSYLRAAICDAELSE